MCRYAGGICVLSLLRAEPRLLAREQSQGRRYSCNSGDRSWWLGFSAVVNQSVLETTGTRTLGGNSSSRTMAVLRNQPEHAAARGFKTVSFGQRHLFCE